MLSEISSTEENKICENITYFGIRKNKTNICKKTEKTEYLQDLNILKFSFVLVY